MRRIQSTFTALLLLVALSGCGKSRDAARAELAQMNIAYTDMAFIESAREGKAAAVALFIDAGMKPDTKNSVGQSALEAAVLANQVDTVKVLLDKGADVNAKNNFNGTALMNAAWKGHAEIVTLLLAQGADLEARDNRGMTGLMFAAWENHTDILKTLLDKGASVDAR